MSVPNCSVSLPEFSGKHGPAVDFYLDKEDFRGKLITAAAMKSVGDFICDYTQDLFFHFCLISDSALINLLKLIILVYEGQELVLENVTILTQRSL